MPEGIQSNQTGGSNEVVQLKKQLSMLENKVAELHLKNKVMENKVESMEKRLNTFENVSKQLAFSLDRLNQYHRQSNSHFKNVFIP